MGRHSLIALYSGRPVTMFFGFLIVGAGSLAGAAPLGEFCSRWPSADGQITWTSRLAPKPFSCFARYYVMRSTCVAWTFMTASAAFICSVPLSVSQASATSPAFRKPGTLSFSSQFKLFGHLNSLNTTMAVLITFVVVGVVLGMHKGKYSSAKFASTDAVNGTGLEIKGIVFILVMVSASFSIIGYGSATHMAEKSHESEKNALKAMVGSVLMLLPTGLLIILTVLLTDFGLESLLHQI
ncbi:hypothetical protein JCM8547_006355 [Rhodosporidiobolus lusitaniae]